MGQGGLVVVAVGMRQRGDSCTRVLSRQASILDQAGYIAIRKGHVGKWPRTWLKLTPEGRIAFNDHLDTLREIVDPHPSPTAPPGARPKKMG